MKLSYKGHTITQVKTLSQYRNTYKTEGYNVVKDGKYMGTHSTLKKAKTWVDKNNQEESNIQQLNDKLTMMNEEILPGVLNLGSRFLLYWKNHWILNTKHGLERILQRNLLSKEQLQKLFQKALDKFDQLKSRAGEYLFFSRSLNQGFISTADKDGNLVLITFLPPGRKNPMPGTEVKLIESTEYTYVEVD